MDLLRLFRYDDWANREEVERLHNVDSPGALRILAHIIGAQWLWITRVRGKDAKMAVWPELSLDQCAAELDPLRDAWLAILCGDLTKRLEYRNSKGEPWSSPLDDVLTHVIMHGAYHRGQMATLVRQGGDAPAYTDLIHAARNHFI